SDLSAEPRRRGGAALRRDRQGAGDSDRYGDVALVPRARQAAPGDGPQRRRRAAAEDRALNDVGMSPLPLSDADLHAYADGKAPPERIAMIENALRSDP